MEDVKLPPPRRVGQAYDPPSLLTADLLYEGIVGLVEKEDKSQMFEQLQKLFRGLQSKADKELFDTLFIVPGLQALRSCLEQMEPIRDETCLEQLEMLIDTFQPSYEEFEESSYEEY